MLRLPGRLADELDRTVRDINRLVDLDDRVEFLEKRFELWTCVDGQFGAIVDWPGCPLVVAGAGEGSVVVRAQVGCRGDFCPGADANLDMYIEAELGDLKLEYREPDEVAWLICTDRGDLREACKSVASRVAHVTEQLRDSDAELDPPITSFDERVEVGPW
ncbi:MAG: hypothetical protein WKF96_21300 [Solirubrobacteraceae bacterium]